MANDAEFVLDEIVVTAQKREQSLQDTALSVSVLSGDTLEAMSVRNTTQLEELVPNTTVRSDRPGQSIPSIRGVGTPIEGLGVDQGVAIYVDGVLVDSPIASLISVLDLERVEVLRGPQGTLYGRNAVGGVINLISREPGEDFQGRFHAGIGNYSSWEGGLSVEGALIPGALSGRIGAIYQHNDDGWFANDAFEFIGERVADNGAMENVTARTLLVYQPADDLRIALSADYSEMNTSGPAWQPLDDVNALAMALSLQGLDLPVYSDDDGDVFRLAHNLDSINETRIYGGGLTFNYQISERMEFVSITGYRRNGIEIEEDIDASPYRYLEVASDATAESLSQELRLHYSADKVDGVFGLFYVDSDYSNMFSVDVAAEFIDAAGGSEPAITRPSSDLQVIAVFTQWDWGVTDDLTLTLGGRWSEADKSASRTEYVFTDVALAAMLAGEERCFILGSGIGPDDQPECLTTLSIPGQGDVPLPPTVTEAAGDGSWSNFSPKLGVRYQVDDDLMIYASYSQGYRDGGVEGTAANFREFDEETLNAYEAGIRSDWSDGRLRINGALFYYDYQDLQIELSQLVNNLVSTSVFNAGEAELTGAEIESTWRANEMLQVSLNIGWLDTEITELDRSDPSVDFGFLREGNEFGQAPEWTASLIPVFFFPLTQGSLAWRNEINVSDSYFQDFANGGFADETDAQVLTGANIANGVPPADAVVAPGTLIDSERLDSRVIVNSSLSYLSDNGRFEAVIWARNLFEEEYAVNREFNNGIVYTNALYGAPRTYGANISYRF